ncbi:MAG TPA: NAD-dependent epimerase/dehydratase family protein [Solimonas sp.]|nr:NAD-dependent epimerase/dehydratase family protein [Solimonas sp.]
MAQVFVTGGSGFVGRHLIRTLVQRGDTVLALARSPAAQAAVGALGARPVAADLLDVSAEQLRGCSVVFHSAAVVDEWGPREHFQKINVEGTAHLLEVARAAGVQRFVHIGTEAAFAVGPPLVNLDESTPLPDNPLPRYPATKNVAEKLVRAASSEAMQTVVVRPRLIWGPDDTSVLPNLVERVRRGQFAWVGGGRYLTSSCHVANVVHGALLAAEKGQGGEAYFLTDGEPAPFRDFLSALLATRGAHPADKSIPLGVAKVLARTCEFLWEHLPLPGAPPMTRMAIVLGCQEVTVSDAKARRELGYVPVISREAGLAELGAPSPGAVAPLARATR